MIDSTNLDTLPSLAGTVKFYQRHLFICTGRADWPERIEQGGGFPQALAEAVAPHLEAMPLKVKLTACDEPSPDDGHDLLVFPDAVRYLGVRPADFPALINDHLVGNQLSERIPHQPLAGWHVFVCVHGRRDERCGRCGPPLAARFQAELAARALSDQVTVRRTSHVGGHAYAGNVLIYPGGEWYGTVTPEDVPELIEQHLLAGNVVTRLWRGRMGVNSGS
ncbi:MAG: sucrase ferredoxin [Chloroflexi bacterium]|nr:sucrase ferredoxin [Chloroflexota bacterium]MCI0576607.1 sucrase ferredoxin [Chloroflexota bacterium]MCI0647025.1 sucrase ferredoxin [Chloroflexota bacterium]MCI0730725.1 sucrase ferredoxin [Chloroflexota bacterium]